MQNVKCDVLLRINSISLQYQLTVNGTYSKWKPKRLWNAKVARHDCIEIPGDKAVEYGICYQHGKNVCHSKVVINVDRSEKIIPLKTHRCKSNQIKSNQIKSPDMFHRTVHVLIIIK